jgi:hypothetical protein
MPKQNNSFRGTGNSIFCFEPNPNILPFSNFAFSQYIFKILTQIKTNQSLVSTTSWQHGSQICFSTFRVKSCKIANNSTTRGAREKIITDLESLEFFNSFDSI